MYFFHQVTSLVLFQVRLSSMYYIHSIEEGLARKTTNVPEEVRQDVM